MSALLQWGGEIDRSQRRGLRISRISDDTKHSSAIRPWTEAAKGSFSDIELNEAKMDFDQRSFRDALGLFVTGVTVITTNDADGAPIGITANSFNSVSLSPPLVLWSVGNESRSVKAFEQSDWFAVHILRDDQMALSQRFASRGNDKFAGLKLDVGLGGVPLLNSCAARLESRIYGRYPAGDHMLCIAEVRRLEFDRESRPLVYHGGTYAELADVVPED